MVLVKRATQCVEVNHEQRRITSAERLLPYERLDAAIDDFIRGRIRNSKVRVAFTKNVARNNQHIIGNCGFDEFECPCPMAL